MQLELMGCLPKQPASQSLLGLRNDDPSSCGSLVSEPALSEGIRPTRFVTDGETE